MKRQTKIRNKKKKYESPEIKQYDVADLTSDWHYGIYGGEVSIPGGCSCGCPE